MKNPAGSSSGRVFAAKTEKISQIKTNVFGGKTGKIVGNIHKNPIIMGKNREIADAFVKLTKIGIEIYNPFVYNVFIAASKTKAASLEGGAFPKGD